MVVEPPSVPAQDRAKLAETLFETLRLTSVCFANSASLSLLASGRVSGLSVETGAGVTHVCPVFQGLVLAHAQRRVEVGGQDISGLVCQTLRQHGVQIEVGESRHEKAAGNGSVTSTCMLDCSCVWANGCDSSRMHGR